MQKQLHVGKISGVFGIKGWVKVFSYTRCRIDILSYTPWLLKKDSAVQTFQVLSGKAQGQSVVAQLQGVTSREIASSLIGWDIYIEYTQLPKPAQDEYYWTDLIGMSVENSQGVMLGVIDSLLETGANDVLLVQGQRLHAIPFLKGQTVLEVDLSQKKMRVDWDADF